MWNPVYTNYLIYAGLIAFLGYFYFIMAKAAKKKACFSPANLKISGDWDVKPNEEEIRILLLGDTGSGKEIQRKVALASAKTCEEKGCDFALMLGDNFLQHGVTGLDDPQFQEKFETMYPHPFPFYAVVGNHDLRGDWKAQVRYTKQSDRWIMPSLNYTFNAGPVHFQGINTSCRICTLFKLKRKTQKPWYIAFGHHPMVSNGRGNHRGMIWLERLKMRSAKLDFYFSGHHHTLSHHKYHSIDQVISGGGGSTPPTVPSQMSKYSQFMLEKNGYVWMRFTKDKAEAHYYDFKGNEVYQFVKEK